MDGDPKKLPCELCGRARPPEPNAEVHTKSCTFACGYPLPHRDELVPERALRRFVDERLVLKNDQLDRLVAAVGNEMRELRADRARLARLVEGSWPVGKPPKGVKLVTVIVDFQGERMTFVMRPGPNGLDLDCTKGVRAAEPSVGSLVAEPELDGTGTLNLRVSGEWVRR